MMGAGKSSIGRALAERTERPYVDTDLVLQRRFGRPVSQVFKIYGEEAFRGHETSVLRGLEPAPCVVSTGGGIVLREENWAEMKRLGVSVFLKVADETLAERLSVSKKRRPLLDVEDWETRLQEIASTRGDLYAKADITVELGAAEVADATERVLEALLAWEAAHP